MEYVVDITEPYNHINILDEEGEVAASFPINVSGCTTYTLFLEACLARNIDVRNVRGDDLLKNLNSLK